MYTFRPAAEKDIEKIVTLTRDAGPGLTTVPRNPDQVASYIDESLKCIDGDKSANRLVFVVEDGTNILGISAILPSLGKERPYCSFKLSRHSRRSTNPVLTTTHNTLQFTTEFDGHTALATLYLSANARGKGLGPLLSLGRLAFINEHRHLFSQRLVADIRGWLDENGNAPFWNFISSKFIDLPFKEADELSAIDGQFISELLPSLPILLNLLPEEAKDYIGKPHRLSKKAMNILLSAGFKTTDLCDVFDGGPAIACDITDTAIARSAITAVNFGHSDNPDKLLHFTGLGKDFVACFAPGKLSKQLASPEVQNNFQTEHVKIAASRFENQ